MSSVAFLWGIPQGAAGPESGVETPNLMTSAAWALPHPTKASPATARNAAHLTQRGAVIVAPPWVRGRFRGPLRTRTIETRITPCQPRVSGTDVDPSLGRASCATSLELMGVGAS